MYALKEKVSEGLSGLFSKSTSSSSSKSTPPDPQARPKLKGRKSLFSYLSLAIPPMPFSGSKSEDRHLEADAVESPQAFYSDVNTDFQEEALDIFSGHNLVCKTKEVPANFGEKECGSACEKKEKLDNLGVNDEPASGRSTGSLDVFEEALDQCSPQKTLSDLTDESAFLSAELYEFLGFCLPNIVKGCKWILLYSTLKHGISLRTLIRQSHNLSGPCLLIVGDTRGAVFGGLLECPLEPTGNRKYQGTNRTFVFTTKYGEPRLFRPTGANHYYYLCLNDLLALGGGGTFALRLDEDLLSGTSGPCDTFGSLCLAHDPEFELKNVELWGFAHASRYFK